MLCYNPTIHPLDNYEPAICVLQTHQFRRVLTRCVAVPELAVIAVSKRHHGAVLHQQHGVRATRRHLLDAAGDAGDLVVRQRKQAVVSNGSERKRCAMVARPSTNHAVESQLHLPTLMPSCRAWSVSRCDHGVIFCS